MNASLTVTTKKCGLAALASLLFLLAFPPFSLWPLAFVCLIPLLHALRDTAPKTAFKLGGLFAFLFNAGLLHWIVFNPAVEAWVRPLLYLGVVLIAAYLSLFVAAAVLIARWIGLRTRLPLWFVLPFAWTAADYLRSLGIMGFPWGAIGYAFTRFLPAIQMAEFAGVWGLVFWTVLVNGILYHSSLRFAALLRERRLPARREWAGLCAGLIAILLPVIGGQARLRQIEPLIHSEPRVSVALIQGNIEQGIRWDNEFQEFNWRTYRDLSQQAAQAKTDLIIWPETAMPFYLRYQDRYLSQMIKLVNGINTPILTGVPDYVRDYKTNTTLFYNSSFLFAPRQGLAGQYAKAHLAPFGERFPLKEYIPFLKNVNFGEGEWTPGTDTLLFRLDTLRFANLICFESIFGDITRAHVRRGARFFAVITNDGWFGRSGAARQHADMAVIRAVETRRAVARCANSGISMFILPDGRVEKPTPLYRQVVVAGMIPAMAGLTFYVRHGNLFLLTAMALFAGMLLIAAFKPRP